MMADRRLSQSDTVPGAARISQGSPVSLTFIMMLMFSMIRRDFIRLMSFPAEWDLWGTYPDELFELQRASYEPGNENASEHHRNGAFHWWLRQDPSAEVLEKLVELTYLDPDPLMGSDVRGYIRRSRQYCAAVAAHFRGAT
jgi:hypothetical protein